MPRWLIVLCVVLALLASGCSMMRDVREQLNPESWWDEHPVATAAFCGAAVVGAGVGVVALYLLATEADNHTNRGQPRQSNP
jgi:hypothetical protein